jgi:hypothetical protein
MNIILDKDKILRYSAVIEARCGFPVLMAWKIKPKITPMDIHEENCPECQAIIKCINRTKLIDKMLQ